MQIQPYRTIFLLINNGSGGGIGKQLINQQIEKIQFNINIHNQEQSQLIHLYFYDLKTQRQKGFSLIKSFTKQTRKIYVIACGGDGTIMWVVQELYNYHIDPMDITIGVIPIGTGNDFSQSLGWGNKKTSLINKQYKSMKKLIRKWILADEEELDIWNIQAQVFQHGLFEKVNKDNKDQQIPGRIFQKNFCNYFSFGIDGKIGYSFDSHRTSSRIGNLIMYGALGFIKNSTKTKTVKELVEKMEIRPSLHHQYVSLQQSILPPSENISLSQNRTSRKINQPQIQNQNTTIFQIYPQQDKQCALKNDYYNLLFLNINSYMAGVKDVWKNAAQTEKNIDNQFKASSSSDGQIEVMGFSSGIGLGLQKIIGGFATKITQGQGPYYIQFKAYNKYQKHRTYIQIDGQYIRVTHPKSISIRKSPLSSNGKIKVLKRNLLNQHSYLIQ